MLRRELLSTLSAMPFLFGLGPSKADTIKGPHFYSISRKNSRVFLLGFGEAKDDSWFTKVIRRAFDESTSLWLENNGRDSSSTERTKSKIEQLGHEENGLTVFDELQPAVRERTLKCMSELGVQRDSVNDLRPWRAYYVIMRAFYANRRPKGMPSLPDEMLSKRALDEHKNIFYEMPTYLSFAEFMAKMPGAAQSQYIEWLLDYLDDVKSGRVIELDEGWTRGDFAAETRSLDRMRTGMPALYRAMQLERNAWWAQKIDFLLGSGGTHFVAVGNLHAMGRDGIPAQLARQSVGDPVALST